MEGEHLRLGSWGLAAAAVPLEGWLLLSGGAAAPAVAALALAVVGCWLLFRAASAPGAFAGALLAGLPMAYAQGSWAEPLGAVALALLALAWGLLGASWLPGTRPAGAAPRA